MVFSSTEMGTLLIVGVCELRRTDCRKDSLMFNFQLGCLVCSFLINSQWARFYFIFRSMNASLGVLSRQNKLMFNFLDTVVAFTPITAMTRPFSLGFWKVMSLEYG